MKYLKLALGISFLGFLAQAQPAQRLVFVSSDPSGACSAGVALQWNATSGNLSGCSGGTWKVLADVLAGVASLTGDGTLITNNSSTGAVVATLGKAIPSGVIVGTSDTQTLTNKTVDGVTPTTFGFLDPTSSVQTQLNSKVTTCGSTDKTLCFNDNGVLTGVAGSSWDKSTGDLVWLYNDNSNPAMIFTRNLNGESNQNSGNFFVLNYNGAVPASVGTTPGHYGPGIELDGEGGGDTTIVTTGTGGNGGGLFSEAGNGAVAASAATASTGGAGGTQRFIAGSGGAANGASNTGTNLGGAGGLVQLRSGDGGATANGTSNTGGAAGIILFELGTGGAGSTAVGANGELDIAAGSSGPTVAKVTYGGRVQGTSFGSLTNCADSAGAAACGSAAAGSFVIDAGTTSTVISTTAVTANSEIFIQIDDSLGTRLGITCNTGIATAAFPFISARSAGTSFTASITGTVAVNPLCLSYHIIN